MVGLGVKWVGSNSWTPCTWLHQWFIFSHTFSSLIIHHTVNLQSSLLLSSHDVIDTTSIAPTELSVSNDCVLCFNQFCCRNFISFTCSAMQQLKSHIQYNQSTDIIIIIIIITSSSSRRCQCNVRLLTRWQYTTWTQQVTTNKVSLSTTSNDHTATPFTACTKGSNQPISTTVTYLFRSCHSLGTSHLSLSCECLSIFLQLYLKPITITLLCLILGTVVNMAP